MVRAIHILLLIVFSASTATWITSYLGRITIERGLSYPSHHEGYGIVVGKGLVVFGHGKTSDIDYANHIGAPSLSSGGAIPPVGSSLGNGGIRNPLWGNWGN